MGNRTLTAAYTHLCGPSASRPLASLHWKNYFVALEYMLVGCSIC